MSTTVKKQSLLLSKKRQTEYQAPKRLSKAGQWMLDNPDGIIEVYDWKAVMK